MKIERISENQIKFYLTAGELSQRGMHLHELAYGSPKAQGLFQEIMQRASVEHNFQAPQGTPLIIEAVPTSPDSIMVIVTKITSTADMEARFGYPPILGQMHNPPPSPSSTPTDASKNYAQYIQDLLRNQGGGHHSHPFAPQQNLGENALVSVFAFDNLEDAAMASARCAATYIGPNALYKYEGKFFLVVDTKEHKLSQNHQNALREYGSAASFFDLSQAYLLEHGEAIIQKNAMEVLATYLA